ncbi:Na_H_antiporter domain-containing protein [Caenorhabditis elegans]|uniref:Na_H_antiporter domain-containing protein n=1 Tax=Caenorhabditis elegans TaxID=6239 RepID=D7SFL8_CAEEL|nr:Na_H_antiporter domain-containing protein [Caenorhabditis elegans]CBM41250.1 Na_H_antiporter domain-containing protein [Caenorhabditis elegans]|eukprot:NP_001254253.1 Uncharacterized protein CELE_ZK666.15 [Caenorhabditis elegans]
MNSDSIPEFIQVFSKNIHLFVPALVLSFVEIGCSIYRTDLEAGIQVGIQYEYSTLVLLLMGISVPLSVLNPPMWFTLYMTCFIHMLYFKELFLFSLIAMCTMFIAIGIHEYKRFRMRTKLNDQRLFEHLTVI